MNKSVFLKIKIRSLAGESRIIRSEERKAFAYENTRELGHRMVEHRKVVVRSASRNTLLAYAFLRGRTYRRIEQRSKTEPDWKEIRKMIRSYGEETVSDQEFDSWKNEPEVPKPICSLTSKAA